TEGMLPWDPAFADALSEATGVMVPSAALLWTAGVVPWDTSKDLRKDLKAYKAPELAMAVTELHNFGFHRIYARAYPTDPARLYAPLEPGVPDGTAIERLADVWNEACGKRPFVEVAD